MKICFYTSERPSVASLLNMHYLVNHQPHHEYSFLKVKSKAPPSPGLVERLKKIYAEWRFDDGRFDFGRDLTALDKRLEKEVPHIDHSRFNTGFANAVNDELSERFLDEIQPEIIIQAGAGILTENIFGRASIATINLHHGMSPEIRGIESTFWCMYYGMRDKIGVTCHFIDATLDTGLIILQQALHTDAVTFADVQYHNIMLGRKVLAKSVELLDSGKYEVHSDGEVRSYYFGLPGSAPYVELKKRNFRPVKDIAEKTFKMKEKKYLDSKQVFSSF